MIYTLFWNINFNKIDMEISPGSFCFCYLFFLNVFTMTCLWKQTMSTMLSFHVSMSPSMWHVLFYRPQRALTWLITCLYDKETVLNVLDMPNKNKGPLEWKGKRDVEVRMRGVQPAFAGLWAERVKENNQPPELEKTTEWLFLGVSRKKNSLPAPRLRGDLCQTSGFRSKVTHSCCFSL